MLPNDHEGFLYRPMIKVLRSLYTGEEEGMGMNSSNCQGSLLQRSFCSGGGKGIKGAGRRGLQKGRQANVADMESVRAARACWHFPCLWRPPTP